MKQMNSTFNTALFAVLVAKLLCFPNDTKITSK